MNSNLAEALNKVVQEKIQDFIRQISDNYELDYFDVLDVWNCMEAGYSFDNAKTEKKAEKKATKTEKPEKTEKKATKTEKPEKPEKPEKTEKKAAKTEKKSEKTSKPEKKVTKNDKTVKKAGVKDSDIKTCPYENTKGKNAGEKCGVKVKEGIYCSKHKKFEPEDKPEDKPDKKKSTKKTSTDKKSPEKKASPELKFSMNKNHNVLWNPETGFYIKSKDDKTVVGKIVDDDTLFFSKSSSLRPFLS